MKFSKIRAVTAAIVAGLVMASAHASSGYRDRYPLPQPGMSGWALNVNFSAKIPQPSEVDKLAAMGVKWVRDDICWQSIETNPGVYNFLKYDLLLQILTNKGIRPILTFGYDHTLYGRGAPVSGRARDAFLKWVKVVVTRYKGRGIVWEVWNEPNHSRYWRGEPNADAYASLACAVGQTVRQTAPEEWLIGPGTSGFDWAYLERVFQGGVLQYFDAVSVHPYRSDRKPETAIADFGKLREMIDKYRPADHPVALMSSEWGYSLNWRGISASRQADYAVRSLMSTAVADARLSVWFSWRDAGANHDDDHDWFGTTSYALSLKPAYNAIKLFRTGLNGFEYRMRMSLGSPDDYVLIFQKGSEVRMVAWTASDTAHDVTLPVSPGTFDATSLGGSWSTSAADGLNLHLTGTPMMVIPRGSNAMLLLAAGWGKLPSSASVSSPEDLGSVLESALISPTWQDAPAGTVLEVKDKCTSDPLASPILSKTLLTDLRNLSMSSGQVRQLLQSLPRLQDRSGEPHTLELSLRLPDGTTTSQQMKLYHSNPVFVSFLPPQQGRLALLVQNPTGRSFSGQLRAERANGQFIDVPVRLTPGDTLRRVYVDELGQTALASGIRLKLYSDGAPDPEDPVFSTNLVKADRLPDPSQGDYQLLNGGSDGVSSNSRTSVVPAPGGMGFSGMKAVRIDYSKGAGWKYFALNPPNSIVDLRWDGRPVRMAMWVLGDGSGNTLRMRYRDSSGQMFQYTYGKLDWTGWRYLSLPLDQFEGSWGGANDGVIHYPLRVGYPVIIDSNTSSSSSGSVIVAGLTILTVLGKQGLRPSKTCSIRLPHQSGSPRSRADAFSSVQVRQSIVEGVFQVANAQNPKGPGPIRG